MAGKKYHVDIINNTLKKMITLLFENGIDDWFIAYGTLLGIIRNNSCIDGDDDVDIIINITHYEKLKEILIKNGFIIEYGYGINNSNNILKTKETDEYCSVDFYCATVDTNGNFIDKWEKVIWTLCYQDVASKNFIQKEWNGLTLNIPNNYINKLIGRYGGNWQIPQQSKGVQPRKKLL